MKKNLLTIGILGMSISATAQLTVSIGDKALVTVKSETLLYNGGSLKTKGSGVLDIYGNVIVNGTGNSNSVLETLKADGITKNTDGGNIILRITEADNSKYGQLAIIGLSQSNITGIVDKEYRDRSHGSYQQLAIPFNNKAIKSLSSEFHKTFTDVRRSRNEVLIYNNSVVRSEPAKVETLTSYDKATGYYMLGSLLSGNSNLDYSNNNTVETNPNKVNNPQVPAYTSKAYVLRGVPFDDNNKALILADAGKNIYFGNSGEERNYYQERYNTYLQDAWDFPNGAWKGTYGKNIYQFGNPFLTNLDLKYIGKDEGTGGDGNNLAKIKGIRIDPGTVASGSKGSTYSTNAKFITFASGLPTGDVGVIIKPMQTFVVKLTDNTSTTQQATLNFNTLRRFKYEPRGGDTYSGPTSAKVASASATVKQLGVIALDADGNEMGRCYYVVYPDATTGKPTEGLNTTQVINASTDVIGTFEEDAINGGYDNNLTGAYWLYINEANEVDFKGKSIPMMLYNDDIKSLKFEIRENAELIEEGEQVLSTGKEFYYKVGQNDIKVIKNGQTVPVNSKSYGLFYDKPEVSLTTNNDLKPSRTKVVYNSNIDDFLVFFDPDWKQADIKVYDASGKLVISKNNVSAKSEYVLNVQKTKGVYVVIATSDRGDVVNTKIIR